MFFCTSVKLFCGGDTKQSLKKTKPVVVKIISNLRKIISNVI